MSTPKPTNTPTPPPADSQNERKPALCPQCGLEISYWLAQGYAQPCPRCYFAKTERLPPARKEKP